MAGKRIERQTDGLTDGLTGYRQSEAIYARREETMLVAEAKKTPGKGGFELDKERIIGV